MSKFDFKKLREQVRSTGENLRKQFKGTDRRIQALNELHSDPQWQQKQKDNGKNQEINARRKASLRKKFDDPEFRQHLRDSQALAKNREDNVKRRKEYWSKEENKERNRRNGKTQSKPVITPDGEFLSRKDASDFYGISTVNFLQRIKKYPDLYYYVEDGPKERPVREKKQETRIRRLQTPLGVFEHIKLAAEALKIHTDTIKYRMKSQPNEYYWLDAPMKEQRILVTPKGEFKSKKEAAEHYGIAGKNFSLKMERYPEEFYWKPKS